jgi:hypothetical protein
MSRAIWKFVITGDYPHPTNLVEMPKGAEILSVQFQNGAFVAWAFVDPLAVKITRLFRVVGTGQAIGFLWRSHKYIQSVQHREYVWHFYLEDENHAF